MPRYKMQFTGSGFSLPQGDRFTVNVVLDAEDEEAAEARARLMIYSAWTRQGHAAALGDQRPDLTRSDTGKGTGLGARLARPGLGAFAFSRSR
ncbi:hypothetical protein [Pseudooceanicola sp. HF7]|uniref:hypothetical protein n=1 Tax=Pseudooceanicola sp. HF7 TaxID=2721560 RepID=UPI001430CCE9|nr:hypothetical protein [Pseudooceanicola sp. HF7]NIZ08220.1 hypothetical protein [Pseudooceanicola sp. HF7]